MVWWHIVLTVFVAYLFGNISVARVVTKKLNADITKMGSGNPGTTNVLRNFGFKIGLLNFILDMLKGFVPVLLAFLIFDHSYVMAYIAGFSVIVGHIYPVFFGFKGGKGIASMLGVFFATAPIVTLCVVLLAAICWLIFQYGSVSSFFCVTSLTLAEGIKAQKTLEVVDARIVCVLLFCIFAITWFAHRKNIVRLLTGKESKVDLIKSFKKKYKSTEK